MRFYSNIKYIDTPGIPEMIYRVYGAHSIYKGQSIINDKAEGQITEHEWRIYGGPWLIQVMACHQTGDKQ